MAAQVWGFNSSVAANRVRSTALGYALLAPSLFGVVTFFLLPMLVVFWLSLHRWDLLGPIRYVGLDNWQSVLTDRSFATSLVVTLAFIAIVVPVQTVLGLIAAAMLARGLPGSGFFRTLYVLPWICYADSGRLMSVDASNAWDHSVVDQFTRNGVLWAVPQLTDAGIALYYNADLLAEAGVDPRELSSLHWSLDGDDTLRPLVARLTLDANGRRQWGYNAANDLQGIYLNYIGSAGGVFTDGDRFAFDNPQAAEAFEYLVRLINTDRVAPPASDTNDNGDFSRNQFLQGRMALFQSGTYNLAAVADQAPFRWGVAMMPSGPKGRVSVTNGIAAAGNSATKHPDAVRQVLAWMGSRHGNEYLGAKGSAIPAVLAAQPVYHQYWASRGVDVSPFFTVLNGPRIPAPGGAGFAAGFDALKPYFDEMFLGRTDVRTSLAGGQRAANSAAAR
jgi:multiple sugar transport system substrate-binding protein